MQDRRMVELVRVRQSSLGRSSARDMVLVSRPLFEVATWFSLEGVATWFDIVTWAFGCGNIQCRDIIFEVTTWVAVWEVATWILVSRPRNPTVGRNEVATWVSLQGQVT